MSIASVADDTMDEILEGLDGVEQIILSGYDSEESAALREQLRQQIPPPSPALARALLPWVEALYRDLRAIAE